MAYRIKRVKVGPDAVSTEGGQVKYAPGTKAVHYVKSIRKPDYAITGWTSDPSEALQVTQEDCKAVGERYAGKDNLGTFSIEKVDPVFDREQEEAPKPKAKPKPKPVEMPVEQTEKPIDDRPPPAVESKQQPKEADKATSK